MRFPYFSVFVLVFVCWLTYELKKGSRTQHSEKSLLELDAEANSIRKKPLDTLHYIIIPEDSLPFFSEIDEKLTAYQQTIASLAQKPIVNLSGLTNTELKAAYGPANLPALTEFDQNFTVLARTLILWGRRLTELGYDSEAIRVLEFGIQCETDARGNYMLLATLYQKENNPEGIRHLIQVASTLRTSQKKGICRDLETLLQNSSIG